MRLKRISLRGITTFLHPSTIDLDAIGPGLVALVGRNGAGKTSFLSAVPGSLYRSMPDRPGSMYDYATGRDAFVETVFDDDGREITVRLQLDAEGRKAEQYVFENGASLTTGRASEAAGLINQRFGTIDLFLSSVYASQSKSGDFLRMTKGDRKALFAELLGLSRLEALHEDAKLQRVQAETALALARNAVGQATYETAGIETARAHVHALEGSVELAAHNLANAREEEASATSLLERARGTAARLAALAQAAAAARREMETAQQAVRDAHKALDEVNPEAKRRLAAIKAQDPTAAETRARETYARVTARLDGRRVQLETLLAERETLEQAAAALPDMQEERQTLDGFEKSLVALQRRLQDAESDHVLAKNLLSQAEAECERERKRLAEQASLLERVPCTDADLWTAASAGPHATEDVDLAGTCPLLAVAMKANLAVGKVAIDPSHEQAVKDAAAHVGDLTTQVQEAALRCDALRLAELVRLIPDFQRKADRLLQLEQAATDLQGLAAELAQATEALGNEQRAIDETRVRLQGERDQVDAWAISAVLDRKERLDTLKDRSEVAQHTLAQAEAADNAARALAQDEATARLNLDQAKGSRERAETALRNTDAQFNRESEGLARLEARLNEVPALQHALAAAEKEVGDWKLLEQALGRDGIQALEIDAAGPEVARLTNELLESCYGARFSISFETLREKKSARGEYAEAFDVKVYDTGQERAVEALSGGERVIVGEAVSLAIAIYNARKNNVRWSTLFRDETAGALDAQNASAYVDLLRRARALGGFDQVLFVSHSEHVWERADARLVVAGGRITTEGGTAAAEAA